MFLRKKKSAQSTAEYAIVFAIVVGAVVAMQIYIKRGFQGRIKNTVDYTGIDSGGVALGSGTDTFRFTGEQYEPYYMVSTAATSQSAAEDKRVGKGGKASKVVEQASAQARQVLMGFGETTAGGLSVAGNLSVNAATYNLGSDANAINATDLIENEYKK